MVDVKVSEPVVALISTKRSFSSLGATVQSGWSPYSCGLVLGTKLKC